MPPTVLRIKDISVTVAQDEDAINSAPQEFAERPKDQDASLVNYIAGKAWPAANVLAEYFIWRFGHSGSDALFLSESLTATATPILYGNNNRRRRRLRLLELGAGTGLASLFVGKALTATAAVSTTTPETNDNAPNFNNKHYPHAELGVDIYVSDLAIATPLISKNISANFPRVATTVDGNSNNSGVALHAVALDWTDPDATQKLIASCVASEPAEDDNDDNSPAFDLIYASDVVYFPHLFDALILTLVQLADATTNTNNNSTAAASKNNDRTAEIILTCRIRELNKEARFYARLGKYFRLVALDADEWDSGVFYERYCGEYVMFRCVRRAVDLDEDESDEFEVLRQGWIATDLFD
ncbi:hypothetical protein HK100_003367 [Physocladia obscura]|uniref:Uncharacterized protein n=1 Tax=Physocladia obscura TaxID=109957 RepID=A0AAD5X9G0_9FUNG|nr:hypothetical protein HK100_003367 [Physocladia obscura]